MTQYDLKETDVVVYRGVISILGVLEPLLEHNDFLILATKEEIDLYNKRPEL
jgi:hypothetical protein